MTSNPFRYTAFIAAFLMAFSIAGSTPAAEKQHEPFELTISTLPAGFATYTIGVALADQINKHSKWLKAVHIEGRGPAEHMKYLVRNPDKRKGYLFFNTTWDWWEAKQGIGPYKQFPFDYSQFRFIFLTGVAADGLCTTNPRIKTLKDLAGKRVIFDSGPGKGRQIVYQGILRAAGVPVDSIRYQYAAGKAAADTLKDGLVDVIYSGSVLKRLPSTWVDSPFQKELVATKDTYFIPFDRPSVEKFKEKSGHPVGLAEVPPGMLGPLQKEPVGVLVKPLGFAAHLDMPDDVVTEILRVVYENADKLKEYTPMADIITKETLASLGVSEGAYHPAAVRFFASKGIKIRALE